MLIQVLCINNLCNYNFNYQSSEAVPKVKSCPWCYRPLKFYLDGREISCTKIFNKRERSEPPAGSDFQPFRKRRKINQNNKPPLSDSSQNFTENNNMPSPLPNPLQDKRKPVGESPVSLDCNLCGDDFSNLNEFDTHYRNEHSISRFHCTFPGCPKSYKNKSSRKRHVREHNGEKNHQCGQCDKKFQYQYRLERHMLTHSDEKPYECEICFKAFTSQGDLKRHKMIHTDERPHTCEICFESFRTMSHLKRHERRHTGEKPYECKICFKKFSTISGLNHHRVVHDDKYSHECKICHQKCSTLGSLKRHLRIHTGEKPFECEICHRRFRQRSSLKEHLDSKAHKN